MFYFLRFLCRFQCGVDRFSFFALPRAHGTRHAVEDLRRRLHRRAQQLLAVDLFVRRDDERQRKLLLGVEAHARKRDVRRTDADEVRASFFLRPLRFLAAEAHDEVLRALIVILLHVV